MITKLLSAVFDFVIDVSTLAESARAKAPTYLTLAEAQEHAMAAKLAETPAVSAELLLGMAYVESRYYPESTSRVKNGIRVTGVPKWAYPPSHTTGPYFCGVTQAMAGRSWWKCLELRDIRVSYRTTARELETWLRYCRGHMTCALTGYGGGFPAIKAGTSTYPARVLSRARALRHYAS